MNEENNNKADSITKTVGIISDNFSLKDFDTYPKIEPSNGNNIIK